jgi:hypothetical protein
MHACCGCLSGKILLVDEQKQTKKARRQIDHKRNQIFGSLSGFRVAKLGNKIDEKQ